MVFCFILFLTGNNRINGPLSARTLDMFNSQEQHVATASDSAALYNNLANLYMTMDLVKLDTAIQYYRRAIKKDDSEPGFKLNLAIAYLMSDDTVQADHYFDLGLIQCESMPERAYALLKLEIEPSRSEKGRPEEVTESELKKRIQASVKRLKSHKEKRKIEPGKERKTRRAGPKSFDPEVIKAHLFWKY